MKSSTPWVVAGIVTAFGIFVFRISSDFPDQKADSPVTRAHIPQANSGVTAGDLRGLRNELATLKADIEDRYAETSSNRQVLVRSSTVPPAGDSTANMQPDATAQQEVDRRFADHVAAIATAFEREARDQRWSSETSVVLESALSTEALRDLHYRNVDCRSTTCRLEIEDDGSGAAEQALPILSVRTATTLPNVVIEHTESPDGRAIMILYMSRAIGT